MPTKLSEPEDIGRHATADLSRNTTLDITPRAGMFVSAPRHQSPDFLLGSGSERGRFRYFADQIHRCRQHWTASRHTKLDWRGEPGSSDLPTISAVKTGNFAGNPVSISGTPAASMAISMVQGPPEHWVPSCTQPPWPALQRYAAHAQASATREPIRNARRTESFQRRKVVSPL